LEAFDGWMVNPDGSQTFNQTGKIMVFVNLGQPQLAAKQGTGDLASMTTANSDLNMNGFALINVKSISGLNNLWSIDEGGNITAQSVETQKLTVGGGAASGVTVYDRGTGAPKCIYIEGGVIKTSDGACGQTTNEGTIASIPASIPGISTPEILPTATTTTDIIPVATSTPDIISAATTTPEILPAATTTPDIAPASEPVVSSTATSTP